MQFRDLTKFAGIAGLIVATATGCVGADDAGGVKLGPSGEVIVEQDTTSPVKFTTLTQTADTAAAATPGTSITAGVTETFNWAATDSLCAAGSQQFLVYEKTPTVNFKPQGTYSAATTSFTFNTTGLPSGTYGFQVWVSCTGAASPDGASATFYYNVTGGATVCSHTTFAATPASPGTLNAPTTLTASDSGGASPCDYRFYEKDPGGTRWNVLQDFSASLTATLTPTIQTTSSSLYNIQVWGRSHGTQGTTATGANGYDSVSAVGTYADGPAQAATCSAVVLATPLPTGTSPIGTKEMLSATPTCTAGAAPLYQWWIKPPIVAPATTSAWFNLGAYASPATATFDSTGKPAGTYTIQVFLGLQTGATVTLQKASTLKTKTFQ